VPFPACFLALAEDAQRRGFTVEWESLRRDRFPDADLAFNHTSTGRA
jgi:hypothetical protein